MLESIFGVATDATAPIQLSWRSACTAIIVALVLGLFISYIYMRTHQKSVYAQSFVLTLVMLPIMISIVIMMVGSNVARAFSLAGVFFNHTLQKHNG